MLSLMGFVLLFCVLLSVSLFYWLVVGFLVVSVFASDLYAEDFQGPALLGSDVKLSCSDFLQAGEEGLQEGLYPYVQLSFGRRGRSCALQFVERFQGMPHIVVLHVDKKFGRKGERAREYLRGISRVGTQAVVSSGVGNLVEGVEPRPSVCDEMGTFGTGFLWKPESESTGRVVILFPASLEVIDEVRLEFDRELLEVLNNAGIANGGRLHFRGSRPGETYPNGAYVVAILGDRRVCWEINRTDRRVE